MHVILNSIKCHCLLQIKRLRNIAWLDRSIQHGSIAEHHLWGSAARDEELLLLGLVLWSRHGHSCLLFLRLARVLIGRHHTSFLDDCWCTAAPS